MIRRSLKVYALILVFALIIGVTVSMLLWRWLDARDAAAAAPETAESIADYDVSPEPASEPASEPAAEASEEAAAESTEDSSAEPSAEAETEPSTEPETESSTESEATTEPSSEATSEPSSEATEEPSDELSEEPAAAQEEKPAEEPAITAPPKSMGSPYFVSLYSVELYNNRPRAQEAVSTEVKPETWEMWGVMSWHKNLTYVDTQLGDIPLLEAYKDDGTEKPLLLFLHGLGDDKETVIETLSAFAEAGYHAVSVDGFDQGDRLSAWSSVDTWAAMLITVGDIDPIIEYYQTVENVDADNFVLGGFSIGAVEATAYLEIGSYRPEAVLAFCGMCQYDAWQVWQQENLAYGWLSSWWGTVWSFPEWQKSDYTGEKYKAILSMDISNNLDSFTDVPILCCIGTADQYFNAGNIQYVVNLIKGAGNPDAACVVYPFETHQITNRMVMDSVRFLSSVTD